jgi:molecular chaperone DnaJ
VTKVQRTILGAIQMETACSDCRGSGKRVSQYCRDCSGSGIVKDSVRLQVKLPAGINEGESVRFPGQGEAGAEGAPAGDLYVRVAVKPDKRWRRQGYDVHSQLKLTISEAVLGTKKAIETINGPVELKIPDGTQPGKVFTLKGAGINRLKGGGKGDHLVEVVLVVPERLNRNQKKAVEELAKEGL